MDKRTSYLINPSIRNDPRISIRLLSNERDPKVNYANIGKMASDSLSTRNPMPSAAYISTNRPIYNHINTSVAGLARAQEIRTPRIPFTGVRLNKDFSNSMPSDVIQPDTLSILNDARIAGERYAERFTSRDTTLDRVYLNALRARLVGIMDFIDQSPAYSYWNRNWEEMRKNLSRSGSITFDRLEGSDADVAYVISKGDTKRIKIRSEDFKYIPINISQYVLLHECAHLANFEYGHGSKFRELLSLLCLAAFECNHIRMDTIPDNMFEVDGTSVISKTDMKNEILDGIEAILNNTTADTRYYNTLREVVKSY